MSALQVVRQVDLDGLFGGLRLIHLQKSGAYCPTA